MSEAIISVKNLGGECRIKHQAGRQRYTALRDVIAPVAIFFYTLVGKGLILDGWPRWNTGQVGIPSLVE